MKATLSSLCFVLLTWDSWSNGVTIGEHRWDDLLKCDFRINHCSWLVEDRSHYDKLIWRLSRGGNPDGTKPSNEHTKSQVGGRGGYFLAIDSATYTHKGPGSAILSSPAISTRSEESCFSFWYYMHGSDVGHLNVWKYEGYNRRTKLYGTFGPQGPRWYKASVPIGSGNNFTLKIEGTYSGKKGLGSIALDDITFHEGKSCVEQASDKPRFDCDFNNDFCSWHGVGEWYRRQHTGADMNVQTRWNKGIHTYLRGPTISVLETGACLGFKYRLDLPPTEYMSVFKVPYGKNLTHGSQELQQYRRDRHKLNHAYVAVPGGENFYIVFYSPTGGFSIDDITMTFSGPCLSRHSDTKQLRTYMCTFEEGHVCLWAQRPLPSMGQWKKHTGSTPTKKTGPEFDHTTGNGNYVYLDAYKVDIARLYSPIVNIPPSGACLTFWYHMFGEDINRLTVWRYKHMEPVEEKKRMILRQFHGSQGDLWVQHNVTVPPGKDVSVVLEGKRGYFIRGDIGLDDIILRLDGPCRYETTYQTASFKTAAYSPPTLSSRRNTPSAETATSESTRTPTREVKLPTPIVKAIGKVDPALSGSRVVLQCGDYIAGMTYEWSLFNISSRYGDDFTWGGQITFDPIELQDANAYRCRVWKGGFSGAFSRPMTIDVVKDTDPKPEMSVFGVTDPAAMGSNIMFTCGEEMEGVEYNWTFAGDTTFVSVTNSRFLVMENLDSSHNGSFRCSVSKDGIESGMSNPISINMVKGKPCQRSNDCQGPNYMGTCVNSRCQCMYYSYVTDVGCTVRPPTPFVSVIPELTEFDIGHNIHLSCKTSKQIKESATFQFQRDGEALPGDEGSDLFHIYTVKNVSYADTGNYSCTVVNGNVPSFQSRSIGIQVRDLPDLICDFTLHTCDWFQANHANVGGFDRVEDSSGSYISTSNVSSPEGMGQAAGVLYSPFIDPTTTTEACLSFLYRMQGPDAYSLSVTIFSKAIRSDPKQPPAGLIVWETAGNQGPQWKRQEIEISQPDPYSIVFKAQGTVAIDDIMFSYTGECEEAILP